MSSSVRALFLIPKISFPHPSPQALAFGGAGGGGERFATGAFGFGDGGRADDCAAGVTGEEGAWTCEWQQ